MRHLCNLLIQAVGIQPLNAALSLAECHVSGKLGPKHLELCVSDSILLESLYFKI